MEHNSIAWLASVLRQSPQAIANVHGSREHPEIYARVLFWQTKHGVLVAADASGLPRQPQHLGRGVYALHIHAGAQCTGNDSDPFADALAHYDPDGSPHPYHAGDLAPLFSDHGHALQTLLTDRFTVQDVLNKTVIIHAEPDDFSTQPSGHSGHKIACGVIRPHIE